MRSLLVQLCSALVAISAAAAASAQEVVPPGDPTIPSAKILERLQEEPLAPTAPAAAPDEATVEPVPLPDISVKAIVLVDRDHGVAMLECAGRKLTIRLSRDSLVSTTQTVTPAARLSGFAIQGETFYLVDFSDRSLLLRTEERTLLVQ